jgi:hypothetical protein
MDLYGVAPHYPLEHTKLVIHPSVCCQIYIYISYPQLYLMKYPHVGDILRITI